jgi:hypothetical protein
MLLFSKNNCFNHEKTMQFSGFLIAGKNGFGPARFPG